MTRIASPRASRGLIDLHRSIIVCTGLEVVEAGEQSLLWLLQVRPQPIMTTDMQGKARGVFKWDEMLPLSPRKLRTRSTRHYLQRGRKFAKYVQAEGKVPSTVIDQPKEADLLEELYGIQDDIRGEEPVPGATTSAGYLNGVASAY